MTRHSGLYAQRLTPAGRRSGAAILLPGSDVRGGPLVSNQRLAWFRGQNDSFALWVRRAKTGASQFGQVKRIGLPKGTSHIWKVYINAQARRLDVVALLTVRGKIAYWATQVLPPAQ